MPGLVCGRCGASNPEGARFCENCDRFLGWDATSVESEAAPAVRPRTAPPEPTPVASPAPGPTREASRTPIRTRQPQPDPFPLDTPDYPPPGRSGPAASTDTTQELYPASPLDQSSNVCSNCGQSNDQGRRFCGRCGEWLVAPTAKVAAPPVEFREKLRRRWFGDRGPYTDKLSRATVGFRVLVGAVAVTLLTAGLGLANVHPIQRVKDQFGHIRGTGKVAGLTAVAQPAGDRPDPTASWAVDHVRARGWTTQWTATTAGDSEAACGSVANTTPVPAGATATSLEIKFPTPIDVREIGFEAGLVKDAERNDRWQPQTIELRWKNGECQSINLENTADLQRFGVHRGLVGGVVMTIVAGYPPVDPGAGRLDIGEVTIWKR